MKEGEQSGLPNIMMMVNKPNMIDSMKVITVNATPAPEKSHCRRNPNGLSASYTVHDRR